MSRHARRDKRAAVAALVVAAGGLAIAGIISWIVGLAGDAAVESATREALLVDTSMGVIEVETSSQFSVLIPGRFEDLDFSDVDIQPGEAQAFIDYAESKNGAAAGQLELALTVSSGIDRPVVVTGIELEVVEASAPVAGVHVEPAGGGGVWKRLLQADVSGTGTQQLEVISDGVSEPWDFPLQVGVGTDLEVFLVRVTPSECLCRFNVIINYLAGDESGRKVVDDDGKPFSVSSTGAATQVAAISFVGEDSDAVVALVGDRQASASDAPTTELEAELPSAGGETLAVWHIPYPPGVPLDGAMVPSATRIEEAASSIDMPVGAGSLYEIRDLDWTGWGDAMPEATGRARYCSDSCTDWANVQIQLDGRVALSCDADEPSVFNYTRYQLIGFPLMEANEYEATAIC